jgi:hypothetical protein
MGTGGVHGWARWQRVRHAAASAALASLGRFGRATSDGVAKGRLRSLVACDFRLASRGLREGGWCEGERRESYRGRLIAFCCGVGADAHRVCRCSSRGARGVARRPMARCRGTRCARRSPRAPTSCRRVSSRLPEQRCERYRFAWHEGICGGLGLRFFTAVGATRDDPRVGCADGAEQPELKGLARVRL